MQTSSVTRQTRFLLLIPLAYSLFSRLNHTRVLLSDIATLWVPSAIVAAWYNPANMAVGIGEYIVGFITFTCLYEIGYFANDTYGLRGDETPRPRIETTYNAIFVAAFVAVRLLVFVALSWPMGWIGQPTWAALYGALTVLMALHNLLTRVEFKAATFFQLSILRFVTPLALAVGPTNFFRVLALAVLNHLYARFVVYLVSKERLRLPERHLRWYRPVTYLLFCPTAIAFAVISGDAVFVWVNLYYIVAGLVFASPVGRPFMMAR